MVLHTSPRAYDALNDHGWRPKYTRDTPAIRPSSEGLKAAETESHIKLLEQAIELNRVGSI